MKVSLTPELKQFIQSTIENGKYSSASESVQAALKLLQEQESSDISSPIFLDQRRKSSYDFSDLVGQLTWRGDAVTMQRNLRNER